jgi:hypothetical protein
MMEGSKPVVEDLPETAEDGEGDAAGSSLAALLVRRRRLELARVDVVHHLELARAEPHRQMLRLALDAIEQELEHLA